VRSSRGVAGWWVDATEADINRTDVLGLDWQLLMAYEALAVCHAVLPHCLCCASSRQPPPATAWLLLTHPLSLSVSLSVTLSHPLCGDTDSVTGGRWGWQPRSQMRRGACVYGIVQNQRRVRRST
jgi:hypothetical protein